MNELQRIAQEAEDSKYRDDVMRADKALELIARLAREVERDKKSQWRAIRANCGGPDE